MKKISHFLWWCAGARTEILEQCPTEHSKYFGIGGTIFFTALMASFAGGYAFFTAFQNVVLSIIFGVFWGCLIFNLDRYIITTLGKGDGTSKITRGELISAAPRLLMAVILGFVIASPLELKIFEPEIKTIVERLKIDKAEELKSRDVTFNNDIDANKERLAKIESDVQNLTENKKRYLGNAIGYIEERKRDLERDSKQKDAELVGAQTKLNIAENNYLVVANDTTGRYSQAEISSKKSIRNVARESRNNISNEKRIIDEKITSIENDKESTVKEEAAKIDRQISLLVTEKTSLIDKINEMDKTKEGKRKNYENKVENYDGLAAHLEAMSILSSEKSVIFFSKWLITLLFILIEVAPVLFKLMTEAGPYDDILETIKHEIYITEKLKISNLNDEVNTDLEISTNKNKNRMDAELKGNSELLNEIATKQADLAKVAIEKWYQDELEKLKVKTEYSYAQNHEPSANHS